MDALRGSTPLRVLRARHARLVGTRTSRRKETATFVPLGRTPILPAQRHASFVPVVSLSGIMFSPDQVALLAVLESTSQGTTLPWSKVIAKAVRRGSTSQAQALILVKRARMASFKSVTTVLRQHVNFVKPDERS